MRGSVRLGQHTGMERHNKFIYLGLEKTFHIMEWKRKQSMNFVALYCNYRQHVTN